MQVQNIGQNQTFNGSLIIAKAPTLVAKSKDVFVNKSGHFIQTSPREILNIDNGQRFNTLTKQILQSNPAIKYITSSDGDVLKVFNCPIKVSKVHNDTLRRAAEQVSKKMDMEFDDDSKIVDIIKFLKDRNEINKISIDNIKAERIISKLETITNEKIGLTIDQPKYFIHCKNKMFLIADYSKNDTQNGTVIKYTFDKIG